MTGAFAEYAASLFIRERFGKAAYDQQLARWEQAGRVSGPVWRPSRIERPAGAAFYRRAPYLLHQLEERIGTEPFNRFLARYMTMDVRATPELLSRSRAVAGAEAESWFREQRADERSGSAP